MHPGSAANAAEFFDIHVPIAPVGEVSSTDDTEWDALVSAAVERVNRVERLNAESDQRGRSWSLPVDPGRQASTPAWTGRAAWQRQVREVLNSPTGRGVCRWFKVSTEFVFAVAVTMASFAERSTGRRVCASRETIAHRSGVSVSVVKRARRALHTLSVACEMVRGRYLRTEESHAAESHHGRIQRRAASVWALTSPKSLVIATQVVTKKLAKKVRRSKDKAVSSYPQLRSRGPLSPSRGFKLLSLVRELSPTRARTRTGEHSKNPKTAPLKPRAIELQRTAAELLVHAPVFASTEHVGLICKALADAGVDENRWRGRDIAAELTRDTQQRGWTWPTHIERPIGFLRWRLAHIDWTRPSPTEIAQKAAQEARQRIIDRDARLRRRDALVASAEHRQRCRQALAATLKQRQKADAPM
ncbi:hypothetical protein RW1_035_00600 [Rhodococcus wratislaviensis NBRC 100605]|uniref:Replication protein n=1 Tax=Rhodococcus wratislaviensis NBRC 100605 TaxID=1219028 RepID=X0Q7W5_RHOWR|nr:hypothetical protein RW1_035_00600 [Rhodococcus wratislaviensis NBRC 100605]